MRKFILYFVVFGLFFIGFSSLNYNKEEELLGDKKEYSISFDEVTSDKKIVLFDNQGLDYIRYYVVEFYGSEYVVYGYYYLGNHNDYVKKYEEVVDMISDYNYQEFMIKTIEEFGYGNYEDVMSLLSDSLNNNLVYIIY